MKETKIINLQKYFEEKKRIEIIKRILDREPTENHPYFSENQNHPKGYLSEQNKMTISENKYKKSRDYTSGP